MRRLGWARATPRHTPKRATAHLIIVPPGAPGPRAACNSRVRYAADLREQTDEKKCHTCEEIEARQVRLETHGHQFSPRGRDGKFIRKLRA